MSDTETVRDIGVEERRANTRRLVHEFATYVVWHLSLTKPDTIRMRILVNDMLREWLQNDFKCEVRDCPYCNRANLIPLRQSKASGVGFRQMFRNLVGQHERGERRYT